ncbi:MAG: bifunctional folylpolyglutamate synthase/dihydrofolate synthase [Bacteroidaceae bacterium]|nr:bifunctional folylpolyglutamate synthase/dihydrofolate synthase [Bacteroidaceae bacterium]
MNYEETIDYLYNSAPMFHKIGSAAYKEGLENTYALDEHFGFPHSNYLTIHVGGTNGKGSCSSMIASYLQTLGYRVGLYTSPHLFDFRERIRVNGEMIPEQEVVDFVENHRSFFEPLQPSFFELTTALAFKYFEKAGVDIAVVEVGLGGKLDCTNIIHPILSVITNISLDHTALLGKSLSQIAMQKSGIIKRHTPVVIGETLPDTQPVFAAVASQFEADIYYAEQETSMGEVKDYFDICELQGNYQKLNLRTVLTAVKLFDEIGLRTDLEKFKLSLQNISRNTGLMGRWQTAAEHPKTIIDTGHNEAGWQFVSRMLAQTQKECHEQGGKLRIIFGMVDDKDVDSVMQMLPKDAVYYFTQAQSHRAIPYNIIKEKGEHLGLSGTSYPTADAAYSAAKQDSSDSDVIFIGGSNYIIGDLKEFAAGCEAKG